MSVLEHHVLLILRRFLGLGLGLSWVLGQFLCWVLVFVILSFFEEGIGNNLTMPSGSWGLESWVLEMGLGTRVRDLWNWERSLLICFGLVFVKWGMGQGS